MQNSPYNWSNGQNLHSERLLNSTILREEILGNQNLQDQVKYVEVPVIEEVIRHVPKKEYIEIEKKVPRYEYEWVERIVEVPQIQVVDKYVDVPQIQEVIRHVPVKQYVDVPKEVIRYVPRVETKLVEKEVEVPGEVIEIPKPYIIENKIMVPKYMDQEVPTVVAQRLHPVISESDSEFLDVEMREYNPYLVAVDVYVPRPVQRQLTAQSRTETHHVVDVPVAQFNALLKAANPGLADADLEGKLMTVNGMAPVAVGLGCQHLVQPASDEWKCEHVAGQSHISLIGTTGTVSTSAVGGSTIPTSYISTGQISSPMNLYSPYTQVSRVNQTSSSQYNQTTSQYGSAVQSTPSAQMGSHRVTQVRG